MSGTRPEVLHVVDNLDSGGLERVVEALAANDGHQVCAIREIGGIGEWMRRRGVPIHLLGRSEGADRTVVPRMVVLLRRLEPRIVHAHSDGAVDGIVAARLAGIGATVFTEHGWSSAANSRRRLWMRRILLRAARRVVAVSDEIAVYLRRDLWVPRDRIRLIRNAVAEIAVPAEAERIGIRARLGLPDDAFVVGTVGTMRPVKNHRGLIEAFARCAGRQPRLHLLLIGDGPERPRIEADVARLRLADRVRLLGRQDAATEWLGAMDLFVLPSHREGTSLALLEASWRGLPVVATDTGGNAEVVEAGVGGTLVPPGDPDALAAAIEAYVSDPAMARSHGERGRERVRRLYSFDEFLRAHASLYRELSS